MTLKVRDKEAFAAAVLSAAVVAIAALRAIFGISFFDDSFYVAVPLRLASGARLFTDEAALQSIGSLVAVPFTALWRELFGLSGIIVASRLFYVLLATVVGGFVVRALRPSFGPLVPTVAVCAVLLAPAYNTLAVSYNTTAQLAAMLAFALVVAAKRDGGRPAAVGAGVFAALASAFYPPFMVAALPAGVVAALLLRKRRLWVWMLAGAGVVLGAGAAWLLLTVPVSDFVRATNHALGVGYAGGGTSITAWDRLALARRETSLILHSRAWWPAMALSVLVAIPFMPRRIGASLAVLLPVAVVLPGFLALTRGTPWTFGVPVLSYLLAFVIALVPLAVVTGLRRDTMPCELRSFLLVTGVFSACAVPLVLLTSSAGFVGGMSGVGAAPFALAAIICWLTLVGRGAGTRAVWVAAGVLLVVQIALLYSTSYKDDAPFTLTQRIAHGAAAGILTTPARAADIAGVERALDGLSQPGGSVLVVNAPLVYALTDARPLTYAVWVSPGPSDAAVVEYFRRVGQTPDLVVVSRGFLAQNNDSAPADPTDPLLSWVTSRYEPVERIGYVIMRPR